MALRRRAHEPLDHVAAAASYRRTRERVAGSSESARHLLVAVCCLAAAALALAYRWWAVLGHWATQGFVLLACWAVVAFAAIAILSIARDYLTVYMFTPREVLALDHKQRKLVGLHGNIGPVVPGAAPQLGGRTTLTSFGSGRTTHHNSSPATKTRLTHLPSASNTRHLRPASPSSRSPLPRTLSSSRLPYGLGSPLSTSGLTSPGSNYQSPLASSYHTQHRSPSLSPHILGRIDDRAALQRHLQAWEECEAEASFAQHASRGLPFEFLPREYQPACRATALVKKQNDSDGELSASEVWGMIGVGADHQEQTVDNCHRWLTYHVIVPLVAEIDRINQALRSNGGAEVLGERSLSSIEKMNKKGLPNLDRVLPYLGMHDNQKYLVTRLRELSQSGGYRWNNGGSYTRTETGRRIVWSPEFPTDAQLLMHCFCCYMNDPTTLYLPRPHDAVAGGTRTFSYLHFLKNPENPRDVLKRTEHSEIYLYQTSAKRPHFAVLRLKDKGKYETWDVVSGRNNLFQAIAVFLWYIRDYRYGSADDFADLNLGPEGLNMLRILSWRARDRSARRAHKQQASSW